MSHDDRKEKSAREASQRAQNLEPRKHNFPALLVRVVCGVVCGVVAVPSSRSEMLSISNKNKTKVGYVALRKILSFNHYLYSCGVWNECGWGHTIHATVVDYCS